MCLALMFYLHFGWRGQIQAAVVTPARRSWSAEHDVYLRNLRGYGSPRGRPEPAGANLPIVRGGTGFIVAIVDFILVRRSTRGYPDGLFMGSAREWAADAVRLAYYTITPLHAGAPTDRRPSLPWQHHAVGRARCGGLSL